MDSTTTADPKAADDVDRSDVYTRYLWERRHQTIYHVRVSVLYHLKRERFFDFVDKVCAGATALTATAAAAVLLKRQAEVDATTALITAALSLIPLVFNPADKARKHAHAAAEFRRLQADCERAGQHWDESRCDQFMARVVELEATEPAPLCALVIDCQNQLNMASGRQAEVLPLTFVERWLKQVWDFDAASIRARQPAPVGKS